MAGLNEILNDGRADKAGGTGNENAHGHLLACCNAPADADVSSAGVSRTS
jgi:hypothetical protein